MLLKSVAEAILLPPVLFLFLGLAGLLIARWYRRAGIVLAWFGMLGLLLLAVPAVGTGMYIVLEWDLPLTPSPDAPPQASSRSRCCRSPRSVPSHWSDRSW